MKIKLKKQKLIGGLLIIKEKGRKFQGKVHIYSFKAKTTKIGKQGLQCGSIIQYSRTIKSSANVNIIQRFLLTPLYNICERFKDLIIE
ncbi:hypothetical protein AT3G44555, partial [Arabidopsis thaliana]